MAFAGLGPSRRTRRRCRTFVQSLLSGSMPAAHSAWMRIGDLSARTGLATHQLRAWERRYGLLQPRRSAGNYRLYSPADEHRVRLMQRYLADGVSPAQAAELTIAARFAVSVGDGREVPGSDVRTAHLE